MEGLDLTSAPSLLFIGMPSAGKTTVGRLCAGLLGLPFVDFDEIIEARQGMSVRQIFAEKGERAFRALERQLADELSGLSGHVIAPGGGIVESGDNMALLCRNSVVCRLHRDISLIDPTGRPLLAQPGAAQRLLERREPLYRKYADFEVDNGGTPEECARAVIEKYMEALK